MKGLRETGTFPAKRRAESALRSILGAPPGAQSQVWQFKTVSEANIRDLSFLRSVEGNL